MTLRLCIPINHNFSKAKKVAIMHPTLRQMTCSLRECRQILPATALMTSNSCSEALCFAIYVNLLSKPTTKMTTVACTYESTEHTCWHKQEKMALESCLLHYEFLWLEREDGKRVRATRSQSGETQSDEYVWRMPF